MLYVVICSALVLGFFVAFFFLRIQRSFLLSAAKNEASDIVQDAKDRAQEISEETERLIADQEEEHQDSLEKELEPLKQKIEIQKESFEKKAFDLNKANQKKKNYFNRVKQSFSKYEQRFKSIESEFEKRKSLLSEHKKNEINELEKISEENKSTIINDLEEQLKKDTFTSVTKAQLLFEEEFVRDSEKNARQALTRVIGRFERAYCPERGINNINFPSKENMHRTLGGNFEFVDILEKEIGVDLTPHEDRLFLNVSAFDPVRRELTRITCEKLIHEKKLTPERIKKLIFQSKKQLFKKIKIDGNRILNELKIKDMNPEIRDKIGSLRYRYSFTQNQYYHVSEVSWLCGLLSSELGLDIYDGRRAGLLHDVGKSMDHSIDGGHAVIGADFIEKRGEKDHIVHAVRSHHFDEQPQTDLAYLVIAADAISGARPGARKSTAESYTQKMYELEKVGQSFNEVQSTYILSAGREVRVIVDNNKVDDYRALELSKEIAEKIESECTYPGQIRVTVVRKTAAVQYAK